MRNSTVVGLAMCCGLMVGPAALAQEWSSAQTEVWNTVEATWAKAAAGDLEAVLSQVHDDYIGWDTSAPMTHSKSQLRKFLSYWYRKEKTELHDLQPVSINVLGDTAIVYYHFTFFTKNTEGESSYLSGRSADVFTKQGDKWVLIGDHGGVTSEE